MNLSNISILDSLVNDSEQTKMKTSDPDKNSLQEEIDWIIADIQRIQRHIRGSGQPASGHEIEELKKLGEEYAQIIAQLERTNDKK